MPPANSEIAAAFSTHRFDDALPFVAEDAEWMLIGGDTLRGLEAIAAACHGTTDELAGVTTEFTRFDVIDGGDVIAVDALGVYTDDTGEVSAVASCDIYTFREGRIVGIRSYTVEVTP